MEIQELLEEFGDKQTKLTDLEILAETTKESNFNGKDIQSLSKAVENQLSKIEKTVKQVEEQKRSVRNRIQILMKSLTSKVNYKDNLQSSLNKMKKMQEEYEQVNKELSSQITELENRKELMSTSAQEMTKERQALEFDRKVKEDKLINEVEKLDLTAIKGNILKRKRIQLRENSEKSLKLLREATGL